MAFKLKKGHTLIMLLFLLEGCALKEIDRDRLNHRAMDLGASPPAPTRYLSQAGPQANQMIGQSCATCAK